MKKKTVIPNVPKTQEWQGHKKKRVRAYGIKQQNWISKDYTSTTTISTERLMISCMIYATEGQYEATADIIGAFLQIDYYKGEIHIKMEGAMVNKPRLLQGIHLYR